jgi:hypothetical protein
MPPCILDIAINAVRETLIIEIANAVIVIQNLIFLGLKNTILKQHYLLFSYIYN